LGKTVREKENLQSSGDLKERKKAIARVSKDRDKIVRRALMEGAGVIAELSPTPDQHWKRLARSKERNRGKVHGQKREKGSHALVSNNCGTAKT